MLDRKVWTRERIDRVADFVLHSPRKNTVYAAQIAEVAKDLAAEREAREMVDRWAMIERCSRP